MNTKKLLLLTQPPEIAYDIEYLPTRAEEILSVLNYELEKRRELPATREEVLSWVKKCFIKMEDTNRAYYRPVWGFFPCDYYRFRGKYNLIHPWKCKFPDNHLVIFDNDEEAKLMIEYVTQLVIKEIKDA